MDTDLQIIQWFRRIAAYDMISKKLSTRILHPASLNVLSQKIRIKFIAFADISSTEKMKNGRSMRSVHNFTTHHSERSLSPQSWREATE
jgi:hypothetical protein